MVEIGELSNWAPGRLIIGSSSSRGCLLMFDGAAGIGKEGCLP